MLGAGGQPARFVVAGLRVPVRTLQRWAPGGNPGESVGKR